MFGLHFTLPPCHADLHRAHAIHFSPERRKRAENATHAVYCVTFLGIEIFQKLHDFAVVEAAIHNTHLVSVFGLAIFAVWSLAKE